MSYLNPWTTATANVHLHLRPEGKDAIFRFAASEWEQLPEGGGL
jgi:hypothetical protein